MSAFSKAPRTVLPFAIVCLAMLTGHLRAADHLDAPLVADDPQTDINDLYAFQSPTDADRSVLVMTVNPVAGVLGELTFSSRAAYVFHVDTDGDALSDLDLTVLFTRPNRRGDQVYLLFASSDQLRFRHRLLAIGKTGRTASIRGGGRITAGVNDDPFFFDLNGFNDGFNFTGDDFFAGLNVTSIVIELPSKVLNSGKPNVRSFSWFGFFKKHRHRDAPPADSNVGVWVSTRDRQGQIDRMGRPAINTALIPSPLKDAFNAGAPVDDPDEFGATVQATIEALNGGDADTAAALTGILLPDILTFDTASAAGFLNGRQLADDVIDAELGLLTNGAVATDGVDANDKDFLDGFPYLAPPHAAAAE